MNTATQVNNNELSIERVFDAPVDLVWRTWTEPELIKNWWGPDGFTTTIHKMEVKTGGEWLLTMHGPDGTDYPNVSTFDKIITEEKIVYTHESDPKFTTTVLFYAEGDKTRINWTMVFESVESLRDVVKNYGADKGLEQNMNKLEAFIAHFDNKALEKTKFTKDEANCQLHFEREFNADAALVWRAWTEAELLDQWWAPKPWKAITKELNFKVGGHWIYSMNGPEGEVHWGRMDYISITPIKNFQGEDVFCDENGHPNKDLPGTKMDVTFIPHGNKTIVKATNTFTSLEAMQELIKMGVQEGSAMAHNNLDELLRMLKA